MTSVSPLPLSYALPSPPKKYPSPYKNPVMGVLSKKLGAGTPAPGDIEIRWLLSLKTGGSITLWVQQAWFSCQIAHLDLQTVVPWEGPDTVGPRVFLSWHVVPVPSTLRQSGLRMLTNSGSMEVPPAQVTQARGEYSRHPSGLYFHLVFVFIGIYLINNVVFVFGAKQLNFTYGCICSLLASFPR